MTTRDPAAARGAEAFEDYPLTRSEYISAVIQFYRGERARADTWRERLDPTTNWAVVTTGGMLSFAFNRPDHSQVTLLLTLLLVVIFLGFEARRFRYFDVWRSRVRMIEENFFLPILRRDLVSPRQDWSEWVAQDLDRPKFKLTFLQAAAIRLRYNYVWLFLVIGAAWLAKLNVHPTAAASLGEVYARMAIGPVPSGFVLAALGLFYAGIIALAVWVGRQRAGTDEVRGLERAMDHWKV